MSLRVLHVAEEVTGRRDARRSHRVATSMLAVLLLAALAGSVLVPALETTRIIRALLEMRTVIEPARVLSSRLASGLAIEYSAVQGYVLTGDSTQLDRYRIASRDDAGYLTSLAQLTRRLDPDAAREAAAVRGRIGTWRESIRALVDGHPSPDELAVAAPAHRALRDSIIGEIDRLAARFSAEAASRLEDVGRHEQQGLFVNAALVLVSLAALIGVAVLTTRERRLAAILQHRVEEESALRQTARALSAAATLDDAMQRIVEGTVAVTHAYGAYVEFATSDDDMLRTWACIGTEPCGQPVVVGRSGSLTAEMRARANPTRATEVEAIERRLPAELAAPSARCTGLVTPLSSGGETFGVLVLLRRTGTRAFGENERRQTGLLGDLAAAVLWRLDSERKALAEAQERATYEAALREAAEALAGAFTLDDVSQQIARSALHATQARGAWVEHVGAASDGTRMVVVRGVAGRSASACGATHPYPGSYTERVIGGGAPVFVAHLPGTEPPDPVPIPAGDADGTLVLPLGDAGAPIGAVFIDGAAAEHFLEENAVWANTFRHLAMLAYEKVRLLDEAVDGRRALERVMRSRQRLMRGFSHDVKNPLGAADGYAELLSDGIYGELSAEQSATIERVRRSIHGALALIEDLHELARAETGNIVLRRQRVDLGELARTIGEEYRGAANRSGLSLEIEVAPYLPPIETDATRVRQIVGNLLSNAIKYTRAGSVKLRVRTSRSTAADAAVSEWAVFDVIDSGVGIPADKRDQIFEEFSRLGAVDKPGAGLGLAISKRVAEALGGHISVESELGHGSTFTLRIPIAASLGSPEPSASSAALLGLVQPGRQWMRAGNEPDRDRGADDATAEDEQPGNVAERVREHHRRHREGKLHHDESKPQREDEIGLARRSMDERHDRQSIGHVE